MARRKGIPAGAFMASFSSAGRLAPEQLQEQAVIAARLTALNLPILTAEKSREYRDAIDARRLAAIARMTNSKEIN
jgi:pyocin large subunit-like protein